MILKDVQLKPYNTFNLECRAERMIIIRSEEDAVRLIRSGEINEKRMLILGGGSNILFVSDFIGTLIHPSITGIEEVSRDMDHVIISCGAGIKWDDFVEWTVNKGFGGAENLSLIPGTAGATPVQNIGAYGVEVKDIIVKARAFCLATGEVREFSLEECRFGYRESIFKKELKNKYLITSVFYKLNLFPEFNIEYSSLRTEAEKTGVLSLKTIRNAVINIRNSKLPDPEITGNAGSFFKNPVVDSGLADRLKGKYPLMPVYPDPSGGVKLAAGWLIEQCGWKGKRAGNAGVHDRQALVLVNLGNATGVEIFNLSEMIRKSVYEEFGISLEREVEVVGDQDAV